MQNRPDSLSRQHDLGVTGSLNTERRSFVSIMAVLLLVDLSYHSSFYHLVGTFSTGCGRFRDARDVRFFR